MQGWEDEAAVAQREDDFKQRAFAAALAAGQESLALYRQVFEPDSPAEPMDDSGVFFPTTQDDFQAMIEMWEETDAQSS